VQATLACVQQCFTSVQLTLSSVLTTRVRVDGSRIVNGTRPFSIRAPFLGTFARFESKPAQLKPNPAGGTQGLASVLITLRLQPSAEKPLHDGQAFSVVEGRTPVSRPVNNNEFDGCPCLLIGAG